ncbi:hypothetical protein ACR3LR_17815 [Pantoea eucalypti]
MTVSKILSPEGVAKIRDSASWHENMHSLLTALHWEDALGYWVNACTAE